MFKMTSSVKRIDADFIIIRDLVSAITFHDKTASWLWRHLENDLKIDIQGPFSPMGRW